MRKVVFSMPLAQNWAAVGATIAEAGSPFVLVSLKPRDGSSRDEKYVRLDLGKRMFIDKSSAPTAVQKSLVEKTYEIARMVASKLEE